MNVRDVVTYYEIEGVVVKGVTWRETGKEDEVECLSVEAVRE